MGALQVYLSVPVWHIRTCIEAPHPQIILVVQVYFVSAAGTSVALLAF